MIEVIRSQPTCYLATADYASSFWGRYIWIYQARGSLTLTPGSLRFEGDRAALDIPLRDVTAIGTSRFASAAKPFGLLRLDVRYLDGEDERAIHLVPCESTLDATWQTSEVVASWFGTLAGLDALAGKKKLPVAPVPTRPSRTTPNPALAAALLVPLFIFLLLMLR
ncbi:hypothetical protein OJF2_39870 [Aquisphaera giovannonii]|uniref:Uncharacterized protein n=1 Tax=Aquisphaera giovannonii TaxID=406548 RepID=A0A5B9W5N8_9BACT|nr:hypothetical protein [Aquisphaera giovannonii]QEH35435.1 hypothetical protein OJF2_39870 [Aquisphaera giovannonii]